MVYLVRFLLAKVFNFYYACSLSFFVCVQHVFLRVAEGVQTTITSSQVANSVPSCCSNRRDLVQSSYPSQRPSLRFPVANVSEMSRVTPPLTRSSGLGPYGVLQSARLCIHGQVTPLITPGSRVFHTLVVPWVMVRILFRGCIWVLACAILLWSMARVSKYENIGIFGSCRHMTTLSLSSDSHSL